MSWSRTVMSGWAIFMLCTPPQLTPALASGSMNSARFKVMKNIASTARPAAFAHPSRVSPHDWTARDSHYGRRLSVLCSLLGQLAQITFNFDRPLNVPPLTRCPIQIEDRGQLPVCAVTEGDGQTRCVEWCGLGQSRA